MALQLWLVDRSRVESGRGHCARARYLTYHAGPHGYGWVRQAQSMPALTGNLVHDPLAVILRQVQATDALPSEAEIYAAIQAGQATYRQLVESRGLAAVEDPAELEHRILEQTTLLEGLVWVWTLGVLPTFLKDYRVVRVETEGVTVLGCTCGLGDRMGTAEDHDSRDCSGLGWMTREDLIAQHRVSGAYSYHEFKTTGDASINWEAQWYDRTQLVAGVLGAEAALGATVDSVFVHALVKGRHSREWNPEEGKASGPKYQNSPLVYGLRRPANPPVLPEDWAVDRAYVDAGGKRRRLGKDYERTGIWHLPEALWKGKALSPSHYWTQWVAPTGKLAECYKLVGPIDRNERRLTDVIEQLVGDERRWQDALWQLHECAAGGDGWGTEKFRWLLNRLVPQVRGEACHSYFGDVCAGKKLCDELPGWETPELLGYVPRRPHHTPELEQAVSRGLLPSAEGLEEEGA